MVLRSGPKVKCIEFGLRRAQGPNGALTATKYSYLGGFVGTSNVLGGKLYNIPISGTIAHSFIMAFEDHLPPKIEFCGKDLIKELLEIREELGFTKTKLSELYSYAGFMASNTDNFICLGDTFDSIHSGTKNFLICAVFLERHGKKAKGIRLDSGDLA